MEYFEKIHFAHENNLFSPKLEPDPHQPSTPPGRIREYGLTEFEIADRFRPCSLKLGAFFDDEIEALKEGKVEPIEDAWYTPFQPVKVEKPDFDLEPQNKIIKTENFFDEIDIKPFANTQNPIVEESERKYYFDEATEKPSTEDYRYRKKLSIPSYAEIHTSEDDYEPSSKSYIKKRKYKKPITTKTPYYPKQYLPVHELPVNADTGREIKTEDPLVNSILNDLGDNYRPFLDSCTFRKGEISCPDCPRMFGAYRSLHQHLKVHMRHKFSRCPICQSVYPNKTHLIRHLQSHSNERSYVCKVCGKSFFYQHALKQHSQVHETGTDRPHACKFCSSRFSRKTNLLEHIRTHTGEKPYSCEFCPMRFLRGAQLRIHQRIHMGETPHKCLDCEKSFATIELLEKHQRDNCLRVNAKYERPNFRREIVPDDKRCEDIDKPYVCKICGAAFKKPFLRTKHINKHLETNAISVSFVECVDLKNK